MYGGDPAHRFASGDASIAPPFGLLWAVDRGSFVDYPLIADGRVFISRSRPDQRYGVIIESLDAATGALQWSKEIETVYFTAELGYGAGRLFVVDNEDVVRSLDAATGQEQWAQKLESLAGDAAPVVVGDTIYLQGNGTVIALDVASGGERWKADIGDGTGGDPAIAGDRVYVKAACTILALDRRNGRTLWSHDRGCTGGGGDTVLLWRDRVYPFEDREIGPRRAEDGAAIGGPMIEAVGGDVGFERGLVAHDLAAGRQLWQTGGRVGVVLPGHVLGVHTGMVLAHDLRSGEQRWGARVPGVDEYSPSYGGTRSRPAAGEGIVVLPRGRHVLALAPAARTTPVPVTIDLQGRPDVRGGSTVRVQGKTGDVLAALSTTLEAAVHPFRGGFRPVRTVDTNNEGEYLHQVTVRRNTRLRVTTYDGRTSGVVDVFAYPRMGLRIRQRSGLVYARLRARLPRGVRASGRRVGLYLGRRRARSVRLLDAARLRGRRATFVFRPISRRRARGALLFTCLRGAHRLGLGRADLFSRHCGRRVIRG
jgi:hypothetical protein